MDVLFYVTATSCCISITVSSWNFRNDTNHHGSIHGINKRATFFISLTTTFETRNIWKMMEYKIYAELWKMKSLWYFQKKKFRSQKSWDYEKCFFFYVNIQSQLFTIIILSKNCFASTSMWYWVLSTFRNLQPALNTRVPGRGSRKGTVLCVGHCEEP